jgi:hypothetical protein
MVEGYPNMKPSYRIKFTLAIVIVSLSSCATKPWAQVWIVERTSNGGVVGYKSGPGDESTEIRDQKMEQALEKICQSREPKIVRDRLQSQQHLDTRMELQTDWVGGVMRKETYNQTVANSRLAPRVYTYNESWREATIECEEEVVAANIVPDNSNAPDNSDRAPLSEQELKLGMSEALKNIRPTIEESQSSCDSGPAFHCAKAGRMYWNLDQISEAKKSFKKGCSKGDKLSCLELKAIDRKRGEIDLSPYQSLCNTGVALACLSLGNKLAGRNNFTESNKAWDKACQSGQIEGCALRIMSDYDKGKSHHVDNSTVQQLCFQGEAGACLVAAALSARKGNYGDEDFFSQRSCNLGNAVACAIRSRSLAH